jgi:hypothetical protein
MSMAVVNEPQACTRAAAKSMPTRCSRQTPPERMPIALHALIAEIGRLLVEAQAQHLEDLLRQARLASAELRLTLRKVAPAPEVEDAPLPDGWKRRGQLG